VARTSESTSETEHDDEYNAAIYASTPLVRFVVEFACYRMTARFTNAHNIGESGPPTIKVQKLTQTPAHCARITLRPRAVTSRNFFTWRAARQVWEFGDNFWEGPHR